MNVNFFPMNVVSIVKYGSSDLSKNTISSPIKSDLVIFIVVDIKHFLAHLMEFI